MAFKDICASHPCYLIMPQTPDSKLSNSMVQSSTPEGGYKMEQEESPEQKSTPKQEKPLIPKVENKSKRKSKNVLRLKTKISDGERPAKRAKTSKKNSEGKLLVF